MRSNGTSMLGDIIRVDKRLPFRWSDRFGVRRQSQDLLEAVRDVDLVARGVPVPHALVRAFHRKAVALLALLECLFDLFQRRDIEVGQHATAIRQSDALVSHDRAV
jgi:hypothetical protein